MGSLNANFCDFPKTKEDFYILGLWCADGYHWSSSIGLSNIDRDLIKRFRSFFLGLFSDKRIKLTVYKEGKRRHVAYKLYVNSRPLLRRFMQFKEDKKRDIKGILQAAAYFAGRFDGDGCISRDLSKDCRISYGSLEDAELDFRLVTKRLGLTKSKIYRYRTSSTYVLYISRREILKFRKLIISMSVKLQKLAFKPRRDSSYKPIVRITV